MKYWSKISVPRYYKDVFSVANGKDRFILLCLYDLGCRVGDLVTARTGGSRPIISRRPKVINAQKECEEI